MNESRRRLLRFLPLLPVLPRVVGQVSTGRVVYENTSAPLANGVVWRTQKAYEVLVNGSRRLLMHVEWGVKRGQTVDGSTVWFKTLRENVGILRDRLVPLNRVPRL